MAKRKQDQAQPAEAVAETAVDTADNGSAAIDAQLAAEQARAAEYRESWQRERADFINYRRRIDAERTELVPQANAALLVNLLPVLDDFDLAVAHVPADARTAKWVEGILLIQRKLLSFLESAEVTPIQAMGEPFDPSLHEAVMVDPGASEPYVVVAELRRGYRLRDRVLRPSMVRVGNSI